MEILHFSVTFFFTLLNIGILFVILRAIFFKPVTKFIAARDAKIKSDIDAAAADREEAHELRLQYETKLREAEREAQIVVETERKGAEARAARIEAEARQEAISIIDSARKQCAAEQQAAFLDFKADAVALVVAAAGRLLKRQLSSADVDTLAASVISEYAVPPKGSCL